MWFVAVGLVSIVSSLVFGRVLAKAAAQQTHDPRRVRGPAVEAGIEAHRLAIAGNVQMLKHLETPIHLN